ncbi:MAG: hypothetical protein JXR95_07175 [Deltaproteobacteria bacterium]|nr:hypothetical protein [Deltaproteobacteria bacterium]
MTLSAIAIWENRIAPLCDVTTDFVILDIDNGVLSRSLELFPTDIRAKTQALTDMKVKFLLCGALSEEFFQLLSESEITVIPFISGDLEEVIEVWIRNGVDFNWDEFSMPGCNGFGGNHYRNHDFVAPCKVNYHGHGKGKMKRRGQKNESLIGGVWCICKCGARVEHQPGLPCFNMNCPVCGEIMRRE